MERSEGGMQRVLARRLMGLIPEGKTGLERLIDKKRHAHDLQVELDAKKQQHALRMAQFHAKAEELKRRDKENQDEVIAKDRYIRDNANKRRREEERLVQEEALLKTKLAELHSLEEEHTELVRKKAEVEERLRDSMPYKQYLDRVFEAAPEMVATGNVSEVQGIVMKHATMAETRAALQVRLLRAKAELQKLREAMAMYAEASTSAAVEMDHEIKCVKKREDRAFLEVGRKRHEQEEKARQNRDHAEEAAKIRLAIDNMYQRATRGVLGGVYKRDRVATRLIDKFRFIGNLIRDMIEIEQATRGEGPLMKKPGKESGPKVGPSDMHSGAHGGVE